MNDPLRVWPGYYYIDLAELSIRCEKTWGPEHPVPRELWIAVRSLPVVTIHLAATFPGGQAVNGADGGIVRVARQERPCSRSS